jgi:predicted MFS family arabinose efflux permease
MAVGIGIGRFMYTPILPAMVEALGLSASGAGLIASANFLGYLAGALVAMKSRLPGSRQSWLVAALVASTATTAGMALPTTIPGFLALRFAGGAASALVLIMASALILERLAVAGRSGLAALHFAGVGIGIAASAAVVAFLQETGRAWPDLWWAGGALSLVATVGVFILVRDQTEIQSPSVTQDPPTEYSRSLVRLIAAYGLFGFGYVITATFIVAIVRSSPSIRPLEPIIWVSVGIGAAPSVLLWSWVARKLSLSAGFSLACIAEALGVIFSVAWSSSAGILCAALLLGGTFMGLTALGLMRARELGTGNPRRAIALLTGSFGVGQIVGPIFAGVAYDMTGDFALPSYAAAGALLVAAMLASK